MNIFSNPTKYNYRNCRRGLLVKLLLAFFPIAVTAAPADIRTVSPGYEYLLNIDRSTVAKVDGNVVVSLLMTAIQDVPANQSVILSPELVDTLSNRTAELPLIFINSRNQQIYFERQLHNEYPDAMALRKKKGKDLKIEYLRSVRYEPWMENAVLKVKKLSCACERSKYRGEELLAGLAPTNAVQEKVVVNLFPAYLLPPADNSVKVREEKGQAYLRFIVDKWDIRPDYMTNPVELQKIHNSVNIVKNDSDVTIREMTIEGYASPEGNEPHNQMLSENRTNSLRQYLMRTGVVRNIPLRASGRGENWEGFIQSLQSESYIPQRETLLSIARSYLSNDEKERKMRYTAPEGYRYVLKNIFPKLRCTNYTVRYTVRPFTLEESERVFETRPINLNLNEIYRLADKYADNREKYYSIIRKAYMLYPNDSYINLTLACLALKRESADEAAEHLTKVKDCPEKLLNEGIVAYLKGDLEKAIRLVGQAERQGLQQAAKQMEEFKKIKINNK